MALATYADLKTTAGTHLVKDLSAVIPDLITLAEAYLKTETRLLCRDAETSTTLTPASGVCTLPTDFGAAREVYALASVSKPLDFTTTEQALAMYAAAAATDYPSVYTIVGSDLTTYPSSTSDIKLIYYKRLTALSDSNTTNWLLTAHPHVYLYATLVQAEAYLKNDPRITTWATLLGKALDDIQKFDAFARFNRMHIRPQGTTP